MGWRTAEPGKGSHRPLAQMVFCIDVRSERIRRHLEASCKQIETYGFAGFFGLPIAYVPLGESEPIAQVPVLLSPQFKVHDGFADSTASQTDRRSPNGRSFAPCVNPGRSFNLPPSAVLDSSKRPGCCTDGSWSARSFGRWTGGFGSGSSSRFDGVAKEDRKQLGPCLHGLEVARCERVEAGGHGRVDPARHRHCGWLCTARGALRSWQPNRKQSAAGRTRLWCLWRSFGGSQRAIRREAAESEAHPTGLGGAWNFDRDDVQFVGALHNTTTDELQFFDVDSISPNRIERDLQQLVEHAAAGIAIESIGTVGGFARSATNRSDSTKP